MIEWIEDTNAAVYDRPEVTPEMLEAGFRVLAEYSPKLEGITLVRIISAMLGECPRV